MRTVSTLYFFNRITVQSNIVRRYLYDVMRLNLNLRLWLVTDYKLEIQKLKSTKLINFLSMELTEREYKNI